MLSIYPHHMNKQDWWQGCSLYEIYPRSFMDSNGDGVGDLAGIRSRLDYIKKLGVDAIWIAPFFTSPMADFGYDISNYCDVDPIFGTLQDFKNVLADAHDAGLRVVVDLVLSHTSVEHPWFKASRNCDDGKDDWYVWSSSKDGHDLPNNWLSVFGGSAWTWDEGRQQYYLHHFLKDQPQLNLYNPKVRAALFDVARFWLDMGVDGFRLDAVDFYMHDPHLRDNPLVSQPETVAKEFTRQVHQHDMMIEEPTLAFLRAFRNLLSGYGEDRIAIGEVSSQPGAFKRVGRYTAPGTLHSAYTLQLAREIITPQAIIKAYDEMFSVSPQGCICWNFSNHDAPRSMTRHATGDDAYDIAHARLLAMIRQYLPGMDCLYQGEELGLADAVLLESERRDPAQVRCRDGSRTPMPWHRAKAHGGFSTAMLPWLPVPMQHLPLSVDVQDLQHNSMLNFYRTAMGLRQDQPILRSGGVQMHIASDVLTVVRSMNGHNMKITANFSDHNVVTSAGEELGPFGFICIESTNENFGAALLPLVAAKRLMVDTLRPAKTE